MGKLRLMRRFFACRIAAPALTHSLRRPCVRRGAASHFGLLFGLRTLHPLTSHAAQDSSPRAASGATLGTDASFVVNASRGKFQ
jgi:hypothetical protein